LKGFLLALALPVLSGCSAYGVWYGETKPMLTFAQFSSDGKDSKDLAVLPASHAASSAGASLPESARIFLWSPKNSAAILNSSGRGCIQGAEVFAEKTGKLDISADLLKTLASLPTTGNNEKALGLELTNSLIQLRVTSERNTYLGIGLFGICQLQANSGLTQEQAKEAVLKLFEASLKIVPASSAASAPR
jgi:hypothetical protein